MASSPETAPSQTNSSTDSSSSNHDTKNSSPPSSTSSPATTSADSIKSSNNSSSSTPATPPKSSPSSSGGSPPTPSPPPPAASSPPPSQSSSSTSSYSPSPPPPSSQSPPTQTSPPPPPSTSPPTEASSAPPPPPTSTSKSPTPPSPPPYSPNSPPAQSGSPTTPSYSPPPDDSKGAYEPPPSPTQTPTPPSSSSPPSLASGGSSSPPGPVYSPRPPNSSAPQTFAPPGISPNPPGSGGGSPVPLDHRPPGPTPQSTSHMSNNTNVAVISGVVGGGVVVLALLVVFIVLVKKKKKPGFYPPKGGEQYYNGPEQWNTPQPVQLPPPPGFMGGTPVGMWGPVPPGGPPPPHQANTSSEFSSGYSGQPMTPIQQPPASPNIGAMAQFSHEELATATGGFSQANLLGQGGFGLVHKGILHDNREVAVKSLKTGSGQGEREFQAEVEIISRVHHRHLVSLVGYCIANGQRMLVYEYVPNKTLEFHLHGKGQPVMDWPTRLRIAVGSAKGLAYLHEDCHPRIIHRDIKAANILLDYNFEAMVADFGLAKLTSDNYTHVSTRVMGTFGYLAPEYASSGKLSEKSDVFSFGVMLLELITGRRPIDLTNTQMEDSLVDWARPLLTKAQGSGNYDELVDPRLEGNYDHQEIAHMANCAAASIRHSARRRPKMSQIVRALEGDSSLDDLNEGVKPGQSNIYNPNGNAEAYDTNAYNADIDKFRKMVLDTKDFNSSTEYGTTSEYGLNPSASSSEEMSKHKP